MSTALIIDEKIEKKVRGAEAAIDELKIESQEELQKANVLLVNIKTLAKGLTQQKDKICKPLNESLKAARALFKPYEEALEKTEMKLKGNMLTFMNAEDAARREAEAKIAKRVEAGTLRPETAIKKLEGLPDAQKNVASSKGETQRRVISKCRIVNPLLIPREFLIVDEPAVRKAVLAGVVVPGAEKYEEASLSTTAF